LLERSSLQLIGGLLLILSSSPALAAPTPIWQVSSAQEPVAIAAADATVLTLTRTGRLEGRDLRSGRITRTQTLGAARRWVGLEVQGDLVLAHFESSTAAGLVALERTRLQVRWAWWSPVTGRNLGTTRIVGVARGVVIWAETFDGAYIGNRVYGIDARTGRQRWMVTGVDVFGINGTTLELSNTPFGGPQVLSLKRVSLETGTATAQEINPPRRSQCAQNEIAGVNGPLGIAGGRLWTVAQDGCGAFAFGVRLNSTAAPVVRDLPPGSNVGNPVPDLVRTNDAMRAYWLERRGSSSTLPTLVALDLSSGARTTFGKVTGIVPQIKRYGSRLVVVDDATVRVFNARTGKAVRSLETRAVDAVVAAGVLVMLNRDRVAVYRL
jgi:hypothetical protein